MPGNKLHLSSFFPCDADLYKVFIRKMVRRTDLKYINFKSLLIKTTIYTDVHHPSCKIKLLSGLQTLYHHCLHVVGYLIDCRI
jgi:hypothetical protein